MAFLEQQETTYCLLVVSPPVLVNNSSVWDNKWNTFWLDAVLDCRWLRLHCQL